LAHFTLGVRAHVQPKSSILIGAKVEISPKGFTLGVTAELEKIFQSTPRSMISMRWGHVHPSKFRAFG